MSCCWDYRALRRTSALLVLCTLLTCIGVVHVLVGFSAVSLSTGESKVRSLYVDEHAISTQSRELMSELAVEQHSDVMHGKGLS